jgi:thiol-disulfide isomerase/thioredoxin
MKLFIIIIVLIAVGMFLCKRKNNTPVSRFGKSSKFNATTLMSSTADDETPIKDDQVLIIYAPWCGHCKNSMKDFREASERSDKVKLINSDENPDIVKKYNVRGYPTIMKTNGKMYTGPRDANSIIEFAEK